MGGKLVAKFHVSTKFSPPPWGENIRSFLLARVHGCKIFPCTPWAQIVVANGYVSFPPTMGGKNTYAQIWGKFPTRDWIFHDTHKISMKIEGQFVCGGENNEFSI